MNELEKLQKRVETLENAQSVGAVEMFLNRFIVGVKPDNDGAIDVDVQVVTAGGSDTIQVLDYPDALLKINYKGKLYRLPMYDESRFI